MFKIVTKYKVLVFWKTFTLDHNTWKVLQEYKYVQREISRLAAKSL